MRLYDKLVQSKRNGDIIDSKELTIDVLYHLWWREDCTDGMIANLFDVTKKKVTNLRHKWEVKMPEAIVKEFEERFSGEILPQEDMGKQRMMPRDLAVIVRKVEELNDIELGILRVELAQRFTVFAEVKTEVAFFEAVERAVSQFKKIVR